MALVALSACTTSSEQGRRSAFNLVCVGTVTWGDTDFPFRQTDPSETVFRVDLESRRYCRQPCGMSFPIASISDSEIVFNDVREGLGTNGAFVARMDRQSGRYSSYWRFHSIVEEEEGICTMTAPTSLPPPALPEPPVLNLGARAT